MIYHLRPTIHRKIWGGKNLERIKGMGEALLEENIGETWEVSIHPDGPCFHGDQALAIDEAHEELTYLVKLIDTSKELSVQVHPGDEYARLHEKSEGKSECWLILKAEEGSGIYLGLKPGITKELFTKAISAGESMNEYLNFYPVSPGDFFYVPSGTIHAIGGGILLTEVQQNSGVTYRVWDWNRVDAKGVARPLHIVQSLEVINFDPDANLLATFKHTRDLFVKKGKHKLIDHPSFHASLINMGRGEKLEIKLPSKKRLPSLLTLMGKIEVNGVVVDSYSAILMRGEKKLVLEALEDVSFIIIE